VHCAPKIITFADLSAEKLFGSAFRLDLSGMRFGMACVGDGMGITFF